MLREEIEQVRAIAREMSAWFSGRLGHRLAPDGWGKGTTKRPWWRGAGGE